ncbi:DUF3352 domain-containing protein [Dyadobacter luticola]|uniref:DUF3352 domain-containing protein n=1 Tax=Dyadobacter luticola TaxID=1979387 RepID=A0A5R9KY61_9BACT|nr:DUF3352 domain-containing protein [Dyadobacter luticola]TLV01223.1 hypothetical protein FEN17_17395 [Dyadobacter luticola]
MSKKNVLIVLLVLVVGSAGYFLFRWSRGSTAAWKFIPSNAIVVITSEHLQDTTYVATEAKLDLKRLPLLDVASDNLSLLNLLTKDRKKLAKFLHGKSLSYSYHPRTSTEWGVIMYIPVTDEETKWLSSPQNANIRALHHNFQDNRITDIIDTNSRPLFSFLVKDSYLIVSYYGDLIEDAVRASNLNIESFRLRSKFAKNDDSDFGTSIYLRVDAWKSVVSAESASGVFGEFGKNFPSYQDFHIEKSLKKGSLTLKSSGTDAPDAYLANILKDIPGSPFAGHKHISQQTSYLYRSAVVDKQAFQKEFTAWHKKYKSPSWDKLKYYINNESNLLIDNLGPELILCQLEENNSISDGKILLAEFSNYDKLRPVLQKLARLSNQETNASVDQYQGYDIYSVPIPELPSGLYGPVFTGFPRSYLTYIAPYLVISNNSQVLQNYIVDYENQLTWKQSPEYDSVLTNKNSEAQLSMIVNLRKAQSRADDGIMKYADMVSKMESLTFQCRYEGDHAFPEVTLTPKKRQTASKVLNRTFLNIDIEWPDIYDSELSALQNPIDGSSEILLTDKEHNLLRTNNLREGKTEVIAKLDGPISTAAYKVDFLNIGRQQRIFATKRTVYALDEDDSTRVTTFTGTLPSGEDIAALYSIDGGDDGSNRFIIKNTSEELFIWEAATKPIRRLNHSVRFEGIQGPVVTLNQIGNRGYIVTQKNGKIFVLKENGSVRAGFPVDILTRAESAFTWAQNPENGQPEIVGVSVSGELVRIGLDGTITSRKQLLRPEPGSQFRILYDRNSLDWILVRSVNSKTAIITKEGRDLFEIKDILPNSTIQYHFFGVDNRFITIKSGSYTTVFDMSGKRLGDKAIPSEMPVQLTYQPGYYKLLIFSRSEKKIQVWSVKLR